MTIGSALPSGSIPATLVLPDAGFNDAKYYLAVNQAHFEFPPVSGSTVARGISKKLTFSDANSQLRVTVTNNITAVLGGFKNHVGTLVKDGAGTLSFTVSSATTATGSLVAEAGTLALVSETATETAYVKTLAISNNAVLRLPEGGFSCDTLVFEPGAVVEGPGYLVLADTSVAEGLTFSNGARAVTPAQVALKVGDYGYDTVAVPSTLPGVPAAWFDASKVESMVTNVDDDGTIRVERWNDVRGAAHRYCTYNTLKPKLVTNALGQAQHIYIPCATASGVAASYALFFDRSLSGIKHAFRVLNCREGGGQFFARNASGYLYQRANTTDFKDEIFCEEYGSVSDYPFYMNGVRSDWRNGFAYPGGNKSTAEADLVPLLAELHLDTGSAAIDNFGYNYYGSAVRSGRERIYESIYYTNTLSQAEIEQVRAYLMKKWLNAEVAHERFPAGTAALDDVAAGDAEVYAGPGGAVVVPSVSGAGELVKTGSGEANIDDLSDGNRSVHVKGGTLKVRSYAADTVPGDPCFHGDADDEDSFTLDSNSQIKTWADTRGGSRPSATGNGSKWLKRVDSGQNGRKAIDFGAMQSSNYYHDYRSLDFTETDGIHTVFSVLNTANGGGPLLGADSNARKGGVRNGRLWGILRARNGYSDPIVWPGYWYSSLAPAATTENKFSLGLNRVGATRTRLNGADVNGTATGYSGEWDLVSLATHDPLIVNAIGAEYLSSYWRGGGFQLGEHILYRENLSAESVKRVEAYLNKKWFSRDMAGYRPATMGALTVDAGATFAVVGEAPITVSSLAGSGAVSGAVVLSGSGALTLAINGDGTVSAPQASGGLTLPATGELRVTGRVRNLAKGETVAIANVTGDISGWTVTLVDDPDHAAYFSAFVRNGKLYVKRKVMGFVMVLR